MEPEAVDTNVLANEIKHLTEGLSDVKKEIQGLREDFTNYLDKEAERWQKWSEIKTDLVSLQNKQDALKGRVTFLERIVFGACAFILLTVLGALIYLVIK